MQPNISDYLHLYLGCDCYLDGTIYKLEPRFLPTNWKHADLPHKPILRTVYDLTDTEYLRCFKILKGTSSLNENAQITNARDLIQQMGLRVTKITGAEWIKLTIYLISIQIDLFGLIDAGLAYNKKEIKKPESDEKEN